MTKAKILELYKQGRNHLDIANMYYAVRKAIEKHYTYQQAEKGKAKKDSSGFVIETA